MFPILNNFSETPCMRVGLDVRISLVKILSTGELGNLPPPPPPHSPPQRLEGNESPVFVDISGYVAAVAHRNFYGEVALLFPQFFFAQSLCGGEYSLPQKESFPEKNEAISNTDHIWRRY